MKMEWHPFDIMDIFSDIVGIIAVIVIVIGALGALGPSEAEISIPIREKNVEVLFWTLNLVEFSEFSAFSVNQNL